MKKPPPPPPPPAARIRRARLTAPPPVPQETKERAKLAGVAMRLRDEQLRARVVYYGDDSAQTNAELDQITQQVVEELRALQSVGRAAKMPSDKQSVEIELIKSLRGFLEKLLSARREQFLRLKIQRIQRRIVKLFFSSSIVTERMSEPLNVFETPDEALQHIFVMYDAEIQRRISGLMFKDESIRERTLVRFAEIKRGFVNSVLQRSMPEVQRLLAVFGDVLLVFLMKDFRDQVGDFAWQVIRASRVGDSHAISYKLTEAHFSQFRAAFEERFLQHLLDGLAGPLVARLESDPGGEFRAETISFAADPRIYAEMCDVMCGTIYEYLHGEGFLDLPVEWQRRLYDQKNEQV